jgi:hypothetical protein
VSVALLAKNKFGYHNRLREEQFLEIFANEGARVVCRKSRNGARDVAAAANMHVDQHFARMTPEELAVFREDAVLDFSTPARKGPGCR